MGATLSRGATMLRGWIGSYLQATMPTLIAKARTDWSLQDWQLPLPQLYDMYDLDKVGANKYPAIGSDFPTETNYIRTDFTEAAEPEYWSNYTGSVYVWVATPNEDGVLELPARDTTMRLRDDLTELVRQALLVRPSLGQGPDTCWLDEGSVNVNKTDPISTGANRADYVAGTIISVIYRVKNELWIPPIGDAETIDVTTGILED